MKSKTIVLLIVWTALFSVIFPQNSSVDFVKGQDPEYSEQFSLDEGSTHYVMTYLNISETWEVNCTAVYTGEFHLFLFNERPLSKFLLDDGTIDGDIYSHAEIYNITPSLVFSESINDTVFRTSLSYTATEIIGGETNVSLYYIQIFCVNGGPDTYIMKSNFDIQPYYIPFINSYPIGIVSVLSIGGISFVIFRNKRKIKLEN